MVTQEEHG